MRLRVVVTGLGVISPAGNGKDAFWGGLLSGRSSIVTAPWPQTGRMRCHTICRVATDGLGHVGAKSTNAATVFALEAAQQAWDDAGLGVPDDSQRIGLALGTAVGGVEASLDDKHPSMLSASRRRTPARVIAETYLLSGPVSTLAAACAAGGIAIASAFLQIQGGRAEVMLAGGTDSVAQVPYAGFSSLNVLTDDRVRPFDRNRSGFLIGEGAGMLILETLQNAQRRKAHIYAEIRGFGISADAYHVVHPHPEAKGLISAIRKALEMASCHADAVDYINAHGTATSANDKAECLAMSAALNREKRNVCTSSFKAVLGHTMGAAGAIETVGCILALRNQCIPPTWNFQEVDPECNVDCVPNLPRAARLGMILKNSSGFGGSNCCLALSAC